MRGHWHRDPDAMLMRKMVRLRELLQAGKLRGDWVQFMLQRIIEDNHAGDIVLRPAYFSLKKPTLAEIGHLLERKQFPRSDAEAIERYQNGFEQKKETWDLLESFNWSKGPEQVDLALTTTENLFMGTDSHSEGDVRTQASKLGLQDCPDWAVAAVILYAEQKAPTDILKGVDFNFCLEGDIERGSGLAMFYRRNWYLYRRGADAKTTWSPTCWLFMKSPPVAI